MKNQKNIKELRNSIDKIDNGIVELVAKRAELVSQLPKFKKSIEEIKDEDRINEVIQKVRGKALELNVSPNLVNDIFTIMINEMVEIEIEEFQNKNVF